MTTVLYNVIMQSYATGRVRCFINRWTYCLLRKYVQVSLMVIGEHCFQNINHWNGPELSLIVLDCPQIVPNPPPLSLVVSGSSRLMLVAGLRGPPWTSPVVPGRSRSSPIVLSAPDRSQSSLIVSDRSRSSQSSPVVPGRLWEFSVVPNCLNYPQRSIIVPGRP